MNELREVDNKARADILIPERPDGKDYQAGDHYAIVIPETGPFNDLPGTITFPDSGQ